ncbi:MAG: hypothetical protein U9Q67_01035 [Patescibacteria group bacterium]|nr:hypothetical protein [Patescibacteria group bacterium]
MKDTTATKTELSSTPGTAIITTQTLYNEIKSLFTWWYIEIPVWYIGFVQRVLVICDDSLSISILLKTFFVPWHRDYTWLGIMFGITMRLLYIPLATTILLSILLMLIFVAIIWAALPIMSVIYVIRTPFI